MHILQRHGPDDLAAGLTCHAGEFPLLAFMAPPIYFIGAYPNCDVQQSVFLSFFSHRSILLGADKMLAQMHIRF